MVRHFIALEIRGGENLGGAAAHIFDLEYTGATIVLDGDSTSCSKASERKEASEDRDKMHCERSLFKVSCLRYFADPRERRYGVVGAVTHWKRYEQVAVLYREDSTGPMIKATSLGRARRTSEETRCDGIEKPYDRSSERARSLS